MNPRSLRFKLISFFAALAVVLMLAFGAYTYLRVKSYVVSVLQSSLDHRARQISTNLLSNAGTQGDAYVGHEIESRYAPELNDKFVRITTDDGALIFRSRMPNDRSFDPKEVPLVPALHHPITKEHVLADGREILVSALPYSAEGRNYIVEAGASLEATHRVLHALAWTLAAGSLPVLVVMLLGGWLLVKRSLTPVQSMIVAAQDITLHNLNRRLPVPNSNDEIAELALGLNNMIARLDESLQNASRFSADASHELRTPLTIMRGELESLVTSRSLPGDVQETLASMLEETERMSRIVEQLFALNRLETGEAQVERKRFDLAGLTHSTVEQMSLLADDKRIALRCELPATVEVEGDPARVKQVIVNLVDNAIKYTPLGGTVCLSVHAQNGSALLEVADTGPGIPEAALPHVFERFYRADEMHSREIDGAGLGLSIVRSICTAHGGSVAVENQTDGGCKVTVCLPRATTT